MAKKMIVGVAVLAFLLVGGFMVFGFSEPPEGADAAIITGNSVAVQDRSQYDLTPIDFTQSSFQFEGYGPGKSHVGTFEILEGFLAFEDDQVVYAEGTIDASSVKTDSSGVDGHLQRDDFFDVENYPEITMASKEFNYDTNEITGDLTFRGVTKEVTFPFASEGESISADFLLDTTPFGITHPGSDREVRIFFTLSA